MSISIGSRHDIETVFRYALVLDVGRLAYEKRLDTHPSTDIGRKLIIRPLESELRYENRAEVCDNRGTVGFVAS